MTAQVVDAIHEQTYVLLRVNGNDAQPPGPFPRPGVAAASTAGSLADFNAFIEE